MSRTSLAFAFALTFVAGVFAAAALPGRAEAEGSTKWTCYRVLEFPDVDKAADWGAARKTTRGLNQVASAAAAGTVLHLKWDSGDADMVCSKE